MADTRVRKMRGNTGMILKRCVLLMKFVAVTDTNNLIVNIELTKIKISVVINWVRRGGRIRSWWGNRRERDHWGNLSVDGWIILGWISRRWDVGMWAGLGWPRTGTGGGRL